MKLFNIINKLLVTVLMVAIIGAPFLDNVADVNCHINIVQADKAIRYGQATSEDIIRYFIDFFTPGHSSSEKDSNQVNHLCLFCICNAAGIIGNPGFEILLLSTLFLDPIKTPAFLELAFPITKPPIC